MRHTFKLKLFLILFTAIIVSSVSFSAIAFGYYYHNLLEEINFSVSLSLEQNSQSTQSSIQDVIDKSTDILFDENLGGYTYSDETTFSSPTYGEMAYKIINETKRLKQSSALIDSIYICFNNNSRVITEKGLFSQDEFYERAYLKEIRGYLEKNRIQSYHLDIRKYSFEDRQFYKQDHEGNVISIIRPFYNAYMQGFIVINIKDESLFRPIKLRSNTTGVGSDHFFVMNSNGLVLSPDLKNNTLPHTISKQYLAIAHASQGYFTTTIDKAKYLVIHSNTSSFGWTHLLYLPYTLIYRNIFIFRNTLIVLNVFVIFLGGFIAYLVSSSLYRPIKSLHSMLHGSKSSLTPNHPVNDLEAITLDVKNILVDNHEIRSMLEKNSHVLKEVFLKQLIMGKMQDEKEFVEKCEELALIFQQDCFAVLIVCIDQWREFSRKYSTIEQNMIKHSILESACTLAPNGMNGLYLIVSEPERIILLYNFSAEASMHAPHDHLVSIANGLRHLIYESLSLPATISIGHAVTGFRDINLSYEAALESLNYRFIFEHEGIIDSAHLQSEHKSWDKPIYPFELEKLLLHHISNSSTEKSSGAIDNILHYFIDNKCSHSMIRQYTLQLFSSLHHYMDENGIPHEMLYHDGNPSSELYGLETLAEIGMFFKQTTQKLISHIDTKKASRTKPFIGNVLAYIETNYDKDINLEIVAAHYHVSRQHFSRLFQEQTGISFNEYVNNLRLDKSIPLLEEEHLRLKDICQMVGFNSPQYYIKQFKAKYHATPAEYRKKKTENPNTIA